MTKSYDDIIHMPHHISVTRPQIAALTGYDAAVKETARLTDERIELDEYMKDALSNKLQITADRLKEHPEIAITYFQPDEKKGGGSYITSMGAVKKIDKYERAVVMADGTVISIDEIISIEGEIFETIVPHSCDE